MTHLNIEIKARCRDQEIIRQFLQSHKALRKGLDIQTDTYFNTFKGRLKLREGNIENNLIYYERDDMAGPKSSKFQLVKVPDAAALKIVLTNAFGVKIVVEKKREIWFIDNVKFHIDEVPTLGKFVEIEASNLYASKSPQELKEQCDYYLACFHIEQDDLVSESYSDMLLARLPDNDRS